MKTLTDITCTRCGCTTSIMWLDPHEVLDAHVCPDGERVHADALTLRERIVPGPERCKDEDRAKDDDGA